MPRVLAVLAAAAAILAAFSGTARPSAVPEDLSSLRRAAAAHEYAAAESLATLVLDRLGREPSPDSLTVAEASLLLGDALQQQQKSPEAVLMAMERAFLIRSRLLPPGDPGIAVAEMYYAQALWSDPAAAMPHSRHALETFLAQPVPNDTLVATAWMDVGQQQTMLGQAREGAEAIQKALEIRRRVLDPFDEGLAWVHVAMGNTYITLGELDAARGQEEEAIRILDHIYGPDDPIRGSPVASLLQIEIYSGNLERAIDLAGEGVRLAEAVGDTEGIIIAKANLSAMLVELQDFSGACRTMASALALGSGYPLSYPWYIGNLHHSYGSAALAAGDTALAMREFRNGEAALAAHPPPEGESRRALCLLGLSDVLFRQGAFAEARTFCKRGTAMNDAAAQPDLPARVTSRTRHIRILEALGDTAGIGVLRAELLQIKDGTGPFLPATLPTTLHWLARADHDLGNDASAWDGAVAAESAARSYMRLNLSRLPETRALEMARVKSYVLAQVLELAREGDSTRWEVAWDRLVRNRGLVRAELAHRRVPRDLRGDPEVQTRHEDWVRAQTTLARGMVKRVADRGDSTYLASLDRLHLDADRAEASYAAALWEHGADTTRVEAGLADVIERLEPSQTLISFAECEGYDGINRVIGFIAGGDRPAISLVDLGPSASLDSVIVPWRDRLGRSPGGGAASGRAEAECRAYGAAVRAATWDRIAGSIAGRPEVVLVGDGPLVDLPWPALPVGERDYLIERGPSLRVLDAERDLLVSPPGEMGGRLLVIGDPDFGRLPGPTGAPLVATIRGWEDPCAGQVPRSFPRLPGTETEAREIARAWPRGSDREATLLLGGEATETAFKEKAPGRSVVHLATHGVVTGDGCGDEDPGTRGVGGLAPLGKGEEPTASAPTPPPSLRPSASSPWEGRRVWLALAGAEHAGEAADDDNDGLLTAEEVVTLDLRGTEWVVLSACHSGLSSAWGREGALGMRRAFRLAGVRSVIAGRWAVEDAAAVEWMRALYQARGEGAIRASEAVQTASRRVLAERRRTGRSTHPFYWAAFSADGD